LANHRSGNDARSPSKPPIIPLGPWCVAKVKSYLHKRGAERQKESAQDRSSRRMSTATVWIAVFAVITVFVSAFQYFTFKGQLGVMRGQLDEMQAARRPWLTIDAAITGDLTLSPAPTVPMDFTVTNIGQSPALESWVNPIMFPLDTNADATKEMRNRCHAAGKAAIAAQARNPKPPGYTLFPTHNFKTKGLLPGIAQKQWDSWLFTNGRYGFVTLYIAVCGSYRFTFAPEPHSTEMLFMLGTTKPSPHGVTIWDLTTNVALTLDLGKIAKGDLVLFQEPFGNTYAD
jgi:hypothetical protein